MFSRATITEYQPLGDTKAPARYVTPCLRHRVPGLSCHPGLIFLYVNLEAM